MKIGIPKEIKAYENRVAMTPRGVEHLIKKGHQVMVEQGAGVGSGFEDEQYVAVGAEIAMDAKTVYEFADMIVKVKEPLQSEYMMFKKDQILFTYLHLAADQPLTEALMKSGVKAVGYETVELPNGSLPLLEPMSEVAGRMAPQIGAHFLENAHGGRGVLLGGVPGVSPGKVVVIGGGTVGANAVQIALGLGAHVTILDINAERLRWFTSSFRGANLETVMSTPFSIAEAVAKADLVIGAVLIHGAKAPKLVTEEMVKSMKKGSVIVDVAIDQGGSVETIDRVTTHEKPTYEKHGVVHYAVANIPGAVARTSTLALTNVTLPYIELIAENGLEKAIEKNKALQKGVNVYNGEIVYPAVAEAHGLSSSQLKVPMA
ncbi:alanine dehydrogenase [Collibacillus ludicampi]|uniref:Alanine dehydrogenase n=1 Tax=Collibacillus ludicampi TaxID=2771369 RepID=A0AAV4LK39_9BACL|nr:alanine dehydrogenase [Collibacillus ludicampi]GIM48141.1 alanine dehydrogenase [Collibacillus ludicampi]